MSTLLWDNMVAEEWGNAGVKIRAMVEAILSTRGYLAMFRDTFDGHNWGRGAAGI